MKNAWVLYDPDTNEVVGRGDGYLDLTMIGNAEVRWRDEHDAINAAPTVLAKNLDSEAVAAFGLINLMDRAQAKAAKAITARQFIAEVQPIDIGQSAPNAVLANPDTPGIKIYVDPSDPNSIPEKYEELYGEWWGLFDEPTNATTAWHLAHLIDTKARTETTTNEVAKRRAKVIAQNIRKQLVLAIPDE